MNRKHDSMALSITATHKGVKMARPSNYRAEYCEQAVKLCRLGATDKELGDFFGVSEQTINAWKAAHPAFLESLRAGKDMADAEVADKLFRRATGYSHEAVKIFANPSTGAEQIVPYIEHYPPDTTACIFWLKNRQRAKWRDKVEQEVTGADGGPIQHTHTVGFESVAADLLAKIRSGGN